jgi:hypothetical protein
MQAPLCDVCKEKIEHVHGIVKNRMLTIFREERGVFGNFEVRTPELNYCLCARCNDKVKAALRYLSA